MDIVVIGAGGIGSFYAQFISRLVQYKQISSNHKFTFYDFDTIETKNLPYQDFKAKEVNEPKIEALSNKYPLLTFKNQKVTYDLLKELMPRLCVVCVDNNEIRRDVYKLYQDYNIQFIDARSNGASVGIFNCTDSYEKTLGTNEGSQSCQYPFALDNNTIDVGNIIIAGILTQATLDYIRHNRLPETFIHNF